MPFRSDLIHALLYVHYESLIFRSTEIAIKLLPISQWPLSSQGLWFNDVQINQQPVDVFRKRPTMSTESYEKQEHSIGTTNFKWFCSFEYDTLFQNGHCLMYCIVLATAMPLLIQVTLKLLIQFTGMNISLTEMK